ncbi:MAG: Asp-tRNA(Asn)/Glu-tRNA(Gln) amidotransferase subunit GatB [Actinobacteria bacterium]|nr:MAG: Asp-tRNA(Asn)/Glu-tRNA(Gln) amidotransferase subunit GatB [Actinomycetota bacterium]
MSDYEAVIGLEIHIELNTQSKMFCDCEVAFAGEPNTRTCEVCLGMPGSLPVTNEKAIQYIAKLGLALNCEIANFTQFHRKNYFYPDMPKDYQISQFDLPVAGKGYLDIESDTGEFKRIGITRAHIEEDTGKMLHISRTGRIHGADYSLVDFNRAGTPLAEVVTEPDIRNPDDARIFMQSLRNIALHLGISDVNMEEGSLRVDANVSLRKVGQKELGTKTEVKNMNSFRALKRALDFEIARHTKLLEAGERVVQETRHWDDAGGKTTSLRSKEEAHDYRYFPEPDLVPLTLKPSYIEEIRATLPELPEARRKRFEDQYSLVPHDARVLSFEKAVGDFFEESAKDYKNYKSLVNWIMGEFSYHLNNQGLAIDECALTPKHLVQLLKMIDDNTISGKIAKEVFDEMFNTGKLPSVIVEEKGLTQITDQSEIEKVVDMVLEENPQAVTDLKEGKDRALGFLVGQVMRLTKGKASPELVNKLLWEKIKQ